MLEELINSKMFWLFAAIVSGFIIGGIIKRLSGSKQNYMSLGTPFIGLIIALLMLKYVKLNVTFFEVRYTVAGIGMIIALSLLLGYFMFLYGNKKIAFFNNFAFIFTGLSIVIFYVFFKSELKINTTACPDSKDIYLLLKKENAGYYEINEEGIGYVGISLFDDGFRPLFLSSGTDKNIYSDIPVAVQLPTKYGVAHALYFKSNNSNNNFNLEQLIDNGIVKAEELKFGDLKSRSE